jgi:predicted enzyme related to lactoylglutathione lyase
MPALFKNIDCVELYVPDLDEGIKYYKDGMGLKLLWRTETSAGMGMESDIAEILLQTERKHMEVDIKVESVMDAIDRIRKAGGRVKFGPFDIPIGKCAVINDKWDNEYVILDMTKGRYVTDEKGNVTGVSKDI